MNSFITALAWIFGTLSTALTIARIIGWATYTERDELLDACQGIVRQYPIVGSSTIAIVCWTLIITN